MTVNPPPCPECHGNDVLIGRYGKWECRSCRHRWRENSSRITPLAWVQIGEPETVKDGCIDQLEEDSREDSEGDGLMTLGEEDILLPPESF